MVNTMNKTDVSKVAAGGEMIHLVINNEKRSAASGKVFERINPITGKIVTRAPSAGVLEVNAAAETAHTAFQSWSKTGPSERRRILLAAADRLEAKRNDIVTTMAAEVGASALWSNFNVTGAVALFREAAGLTTQIQGETIPTDMPGTLSMTLRQPVGVILSIVPWNGPI
jgi:acyl-CoA reductase-like NAD-dependent aldehyde dehydrogenase